MSLSPCDTMESVHHVSVPLRAGKKMKKRKELDALVAHSAVAGGGKRCVSGGKRCGGGGISSHDGLLSETTDEDDYWVLGGGGGGGGGGAKTRGGRRRMLRHRACNSLIRACTVVLVFACVVATTTVMWLFIDIREQVTTLRIELDQVVAGSQGVPDALQKCHSMSRELQQNQTALFTHLAVLSLQTGNFSTQLAGMQNGLQSLEERLKATPELVNVPRDLKELRASVATFGSQISDLETRVTGLKDDYGRLSEASQGLARNLSAALTRLADVSARPQPVDRDDAGERKRVMGEIAQLTANVTSVNQTLTSRLGWLLEDQHKDHTLIEALQNSGQNVSAQVRTLDGECARQSALASLNATVKTLTAKVSNGSALIGALDQQVSLLRSEHEKKMAEQQQQPVAGAVAQPGDAVTDVEPPSQSVTVATRSASPASQPPTPSALEQTAILP